MYIFVYYYFFYFYFLKNESARSWGEYSPLSLSLLTWRSYKAWATVSSNAVGSAFLAFLIFVAEVNTLMLKSCVFFEERGRRGRKGERKGRTCGWELVMAG